MALWWAFDEYLALCLIILLLSTGKTKCLLWLLLSFGASGLMDSSDNDWAEHSPSAYHKPHQGVGGKEEVDKERGQASMCACQKLGE